MIVDDRQRLVARLRAAIAAVEQFANREYDDGADNEYAQLIRSVVRPFTEAADALENKKGEENRDGQLLWRTGWANFYNISEPGGGIIVFNTREEASSSGLQERINPEPVWVIVRPSDPDALPTASRPQEQPRKATGEGPTTEPALQAVLDKIFSDPAAAQGWQETQATISAWCEETFGAASSNARVASRANEEMAELLKTLTKNDADVHAIEEAADIVIILFRLSSRMGLDLHSEIDRKMGVNRARQWNVDADGHGYHVKGAAPPSPAAQEQEKGEQT